MEQCLLCIGVIVWKFVDVGMVIGFCRSCVALAVRIEFELSRLMKRKERVR
jgi:hypothetical protein